MKFILLITKTRDTAVEGIDDWYFRIFKQQDLRDEDHIDIKIQETRLNTDEQSIGEQIRMHGNF